ncbi:MAG: tetratricopeptide repeat protein [Rickettsiales bacterium]
MIRFFVIIILLFSNNLAAEQAKVTNILPDHLFQNEEEAYKLQKLEALITDLRSELADLRAQLEILDNKQIILSNKVEAISPEEDLAVIDAHLADNMAEFKYGFTMLQNGDYDIAKRSFELFITKYPQDLKVGEAYFWLGEIAYKAEDYQTASKNYLVSYRDYLDNPRRNDALFKLSIVLTIADKVEEACAGLKILLDPNLGVKESLRNKARDEFLTIGCSN